MLPDYFPPLRRLVSEFATLRRIRRDYRRIHGHYVRLFPPRTYNEKIQYRKIFDRRPFLTLTSDKLTLRDYARQKLGLDLTPQLYHVTPDPATIPFATLPERFVIKPNHASGRFRVITEKNTLDTTALIARCREWLALDYSRQGDEWGYRNIPRRILVEEFIDNGFGASPRDIRVLCFNHRAKLVQIDDRREGQLCQNYFDPQWNELGAWGRRPRGPLPIERPSRLNDIIGYAEKLSAETDFVRVDFYQVGDRIVLGEMTHSPAGGHAPLQPPGTDAAWGALWEMDFLSLWKPDASFSSPNSIWERPCLSNPIAPPSSSRQQPPQQAAP